MNYIPTYQLIRSRRRTLALQINTNAELVVRAPLKLSQVQIEQFILRKSSWICKKQQQISNFATTLLPKKYIDGEEHYFYGFTYKLKIYNGAKIVATDYLYFPQHLLPNPTKHILRWYNQKAVELIQVRLEIYSKITGLKFGSAKLSNAKKQWGSCNAKGNLNFNWRLIMFPLEVIDYVVVHELVHISIKNHSAKFWSQVARYFPNFKQAKKYLKEHGRKILLHADSL